MAWGIAETASDKEKLKAEFADYIGGLNSCGIVDYGTYNELFDVGMDLLDKMYDMAIEALKEPPSVRGRWSVEPDVGWYCDNCGYLNRQDETDYCPNCGAKMGNEEERE